MFPLTLTQLLRKRSVEMEQTKRERDITADANTVISIGDKLQRAGLPVDLILATVDLMVASHPTPEKLDAEIHNQLQLRKFASVQVPAGQAN